MANKDLKKAIEEIRSQLKWNIREQIGKSDFFTIDSNPFTKSHIINWPLSNSQAGPPDDIEILHELIHALFVEKIHHLFSASYFKRGTPEIWAQVIACVCDFASDWFVEHRFYEIAPEAKKKAIKEQFNFICESFKDGPPSNDLFTFISTGLLIAQVIKYLQIQVETSGKLKELVEAFLSTDPSVPTIKGLEKMINKLIKIFSPFIIRLSKEGDIEVWEVIHP